MKPIRRIPDTDPPSRTYDAKLRGVLWIAAAILAVVIIIAFAPKKAEACRYNPRPLSTYPAYSFEDCAQCIAHYYTARGYRCEIQVVSGNDIIGRIEGVTFCVTRTAWVAYPSMRADELLWALDRRLGFELALSEVGR